MRNMLDMDATIKGFNLEKDNLENILYILRNQGVMSEEIKNVLKNRIIGLYLRAS